MPYPVLALHPSRDTQSLLLRTPPGPGSLLQACIDPLVAIGTLAAAVSFFGGRFDGACLILALLVFAMTFPGSLARDGGGSAGELALDVGAGWLAIVALLAFLGWASRTLELFDPRAILAWSLATPAALFAVHRLLPVLWPRVLAAEGMQKMAVDRRRQRPRPPARRAAARQPPARRAFRGLLRRPRRRIGCRTSCRARTSARCPGSATTRARTASTSSTSRCRWPRSRASSSCSKSCATPRRRSTSCPTSSSPTSSRRASTRSAAAGGGGVRDAVLRLQRRW